MKTPLHAVLILIAAMALTACTPEGLTREQYVQIRDLCQVSRTGEYLDPDMTKAQFDTAKCIHLGVARVRAGGDVSPEVVPVAVP